MIDQLHRDHFKVIVHVVIEGRRLMGRVERSVYGRASTDRAHGRRSVAAGAAGVLLLAAHKPAMEAGVDGWWPDQGDGYDGPSPSTGIACIWEGSALSSERTAVPRLHRNASAGIQRFGGFIWSGDVQSRWETLKTHVPVAITRVCPGCPTGARTSAGSTRRRVHLASLHVRWFQFAAFNPLFRAHGRNWHLKLPWAGTAAMAGRFESGNFRVPPDELKNAKVEPICRKYLDLRYRSCRISTPPSASVTTPACRLCARSGYTRPTSRRRGPRRRIHVGPGHARRTRRRKSATSRHVYLPRGSWFDFLDQRELDGGREIDRPVDLETTPIFVRAGSVLRWTGEAVRRRAQRRGRSNSSSIPAQTDRRPCTRRRPHVRLSTGRVDADRDELAGRHAAALAQPRAGRAYAGADAADAQCARGGRASDEDGVFSGTAVVVADVGGGAVRTPSSRSADTFYAAGPDQGKGGEKASNEWKQSEGDSTEPVSERHQREHAQVVFAFEPAVHLTNAPICPPARRSSSPFFTPAQPSP